VTTVLRAHDITGRSMTEASSARGPPTCAPVCSRRRVGANSSRRRRPIRLLRGPARRRADEDYWGFCGAPDAAPASWIMSAQRMQQSGEHKAAPLQQTERSAGARVLGA